MTNIYVEVFDNDVAGALLYFKKQALKTGLFKEIRRHDFYVKPAERRRRKSKVARSRLAKAARRKAAAEAVWLQNRGQTDE